MNSISDPNASQWSRYMAGELSLEAAGSAIFEAGGLGFNVSLAGAPPALRERAMALFGYLQWRTLTEAGVALSRPATESEFAEFAEAGFEEE